MGRDAVMRRRIHRAIIAAGSRISEIITELYNWVTDSGDTLITSDGDTLVFNDEA